MRAVVDLLDPEPPQQVRSALSEVQMLYAKEARRAVRPGPERRPQAPAKEAGAEARGSEPAATPPSSRSDGLQSCWTPRRDVTRRPRSS